MGSIGMKWLDGGDTLAHNPASFSTWTVGMYVAESKRLTYQGAKKIMATAVDMAKQAGIAISCAIVDAGGHMILLERMDGGRFHTVHSCSTKAVCAASNRRPTTAKGAAGQDLDVSHAIGLALAAGPERWTAMEGGVPVLVDGECIGGVGVSGGDWETDLRIAKAAVESIGVSWK
jgi:glc operon protein GlcG